MTIPETILNLEVLLQALAQQSTPLPQDYQQDLMAIGQALRNDQPQSAQNLRALIQQYPQLEATYQANLRQWDANYVAQERNKGFAAALPQSVSIESIFLNDLTPSQDWVTTAQKILQKYTAQPTQTQFWDKADRIVVMISGGAVIGAAFAQLTGAVMGATLAALYGWYISFAKTKSSKASS